MGCCAVIYLSVKNPHHCDEDSYRPDLGIAMNEFFTFPNFDNVEEFEAFWNNVPDLLDLS